MLFFDGYLFGYRYRFSSFAPAIITKVLAKTVVFFVAHSTYIIGEGKLISASESVITESSPAPATTPADHAKNETDHNCKEQYPHNDEWNKEKGGSKNGPSYNGF
jgi:hypothetical protein